MISRVKATYENHEMGVRRTRGMTVSNIDSRASAVG
jgi:hypothetical protein